MINSNFINLFLANKKQFGRGFTLAELMITVAVAGILVSVAIPNFQKYQAKSKTIEAKLHLANAYTAEQSFYAEFDSYAPCLDNAGYDPTPQKDQRYYTIGFNAWLLADWNAVREVVKDCATGESSSRFPAGKRISSTIAPTMQLGMGVFAAIVRENSFTIYANGIISKDYALDGFSQATSTTDKWWITHEKEIKHFYSGY